MKTEQPESVIAVAIARQLGAGGGILGKRLAKRLGAVYLDRAILRLAAERLGACSAELGRWDERLPSFWERFTETFSAGAPDGTYTTSRNLTGVSSQVLFEQETRVVREAAARRSVVVVGRAGAWMLEGHPRLVRIYLHAPVETRLPEVMRRYNLTDAREARKQMDRMDIERERFILEMTSCAASDARNYDLCFDTQKADMELAEETVARLMERLRARDQTIFTA
jgi:shikimate kinase